MADHNVRVRRTVKSSKHRVGRFRASCSACLFRATGLRGAVDAEATAHRQEVKA